MIDLHQIGTYHENNRIEAKKALGGFPNSLWETYSAFANTLGGIILLGVEEHAGGVLRAIDLPNPKLLVREFWRLVNNPQKASVNIVSDSDVRVETIDGNHIVVIEVPRAQRFDKPVYIDGDPITGSYRRNGEGDYRCSQDEIESMLRDAAIQTRDMRVLETAELGELNETSIERYRRRMKHCRPGHVWGKLPKEEFLYRIGAAGRAADGGMRPTAAGLLMFGRETDIIREYPYYQLKYQEEGNHREIVSASGDWSGNVYDFYDKVYRRMTQILQPGGRPKGSQESPVLEALGEALANCLIHADYDGKSGLEVNKRQGRIEVANPGRFRIDPEAAKSGGISDPRNAGLMKMFSLINIGSQNGSGLPRLYSSWREQGWKAPEITESFNPDRITVSLAIDETAPASRSMITIRQMVIDYLTDHVNGSVAEMAALLEVRPEQIRSCLKKLIQEQFVTAEGNMRGRQYRLKR